MSTSQLHIPKFTMPTQTPEKSTAFGGRQNLLRVTECSAKHVDRYLNSNETYA